MNRYIGRIGWGFGQGEEARRFLERRHEDGAAAVVFAAAIADDRDHSWDAVVARIKGVEFVFPFADALCQGFEVVFEAAGELFFEFFPLEGAQAVDLGAVFAVPDTEGGAGDVELFGNVAEGGAAGAEFDELVFGFVVMHRG